MRRRRPTALSTVVALAAAPVLSTLGLRTPSSAVSLGDFRLQLPAACGTFIASTRAEWRDLSATASRGRVGICVVGEGGGWDAAGGRVGASRGGIWMKANKKNKRKREQQQGGGDGGGGVAGAGGVLRWLLCSLHIKDVFYFPVQQKRYVIHGVDTVLRHHVSSVQ